MDVEIREVKKPWGRELIWAVTDHYVGKIIEVNAGERLSLQYHKIKEETLMCESGECVFWIGPSEKDLKPVLLKPGQAIHVKPGTRHYIEAKTDCRLYEVSTPHLDDVVRLKDKYGREGTSEA